LIDLIARDRADMLRWAGRSYESERAARDAERYASEARGGRLSLKTT
jgi:hypothetical protein